LQQHTTLPPSMCSLTCCPPHLPAAHLQALLDRIPDELALLFSNRSWRSRGIRPQASKAPAPCHLSLPIPLHVCSRWLAAAFRCYSHNVYSPCLHRHCHSLLHLQTMSNLTWAYAKLDRKPLLLTQDLLKESLPLLPQFKPQVGRAGRGKWGRGRVAGQWAGMQQGEAAAGAADSSLMLPKPRHPPAPHAIPPAFAGAGQPDVGYCQDGLLPWGLHGGCTHTGGWAAMFWF
jgi:hypothetical protein